jgi:hypothetical protein
MQRKPSIQWRTSDVEKVNRQVQKFNAKVYYQKRKHPELQDILPKPITVKEKREMIETFKENTRDDFNRELRSLDRFSKRGAEKPVVNDYGFAITKWERNEYDNYKRVQINKDKQKQKVEFDVKPKEQMQMGTLKQNGLNPKEPKFEKARTRKEWDMAKKAIDKQVKENYVSNKLEEFKKNYLRVIEEQAGEAGKEFYNFISEIPAEVLAKGYWENDEFLKMGMYYEIKRFGADAVVDEGFKHWRDFLGLEEGQSYEDLDGGF